MKHLKCTNCGCRIHDEYMVILSEVLCLECSTEWMEDELAEMKLKNKREYIERTADSLGYQILEV